MGVSYAAEVVLGQVRSGLNEKLTFEQRLKFTGYIFFFNLKL